MGYVLLLVGAYALFLLFVLGLCGAAGKEPPNER